MKSVPSPCRRLVRLATAAFVVLGFAPPAPALTVPAGPTPHALTPHAAPQPARPQPRPPGAAVACEGRDLIAALNAADRAELDARVAGVPHARGLYWTATRGAATIRIVGTYHLADPRHAATLARVAPTLDEAGALLVEAGPAEEQALAQALRRDPSLMADTAGPTLPERLGPADWQVLSQALTDRGIPPLIGSRLRPWYVGMMLGVSPCMMRQARAAGGVDGLDHLLIARADARRVPIRALEPWDTVFGLFNGMTAAEENDMIRTALPAARSADDYAATTTEAYFRGDIALIWEFGRLDAYRSSGLDRGAVDRQTDLSEAQLMVGRNRRWIAPLTQAAAAAAQDGKPVLAAFGALHLPGENGVLRLLEKDGWTVTEWTP